MRPYTIPFARLGRHQSGRRRRQEFFARRNDLATSPRSASRCPDGFATTADAYRDFLAHEGLADRIKQALATLDVDDVTRSPRPARRSAAGFSQRRFRRSCTSEIVEGYDAHERWPARCRRGRALLRHRRRPARGFVRRAAGNIAERAWCRAGRQGRARSLRVAIQRSRDLRTACTRASITRRSRFRPASSTWCAVTSARAA